MCKIISILRGIEPQSIFDASSSSSGETTIYDKTSVTDELKRRKKDVVVEQSLTTIDTPPSEEEEIIGTKIATEKGKQYNGGGADINHLKCDRPKNKYNIEGIFHNQGVGTQPTQKGE